MARKNTKRFKLVAEWEEGMETKLSQGGFDTIEEAEAYIAKIDAADEEAEYLIGAELILTEVDTGKQWFYSDKWEEVA